MPSEVQIARAFLETLLETERFSELQLREYQAGLVSELIRHAAANTRFYKEAGLPTGDIDLNSPEWLNVPTINRQHLEKYGDAIRADRLPEQHGTQMPVQSGGSTGAPIRIHLSDLEAIGRTVCTYRMFLQHDFDQSLPLFMIRSPQYGSGRTDRLVFRKWGFPWLPESELGDRLYLPTETPAAEQLGQIARRAPAYVNTLPSNMLRLGRVARDTGTIPSIPIFVSISEYLSGDVRSLAKDLFGSHVIGIYSSAEGGTMAIECPQCRNLHVQGETVLIEILNTTGQPCDPGEVGEVVVTPLYNYATPMIRYRTGDFAVKSGPCSCGRSGSTIEYIVGRQEHMFTFPNQTRKIPEVDRLKITDLVGHDAWQFVQTGSDTAEFRYESSSDRRLANDAILKHLLTAVGANFDVTMKKVPTIGMTSSGKRHFFVNQWKNAASGHRNIDQAH